MTAYIEQLKEKESQLQVREVALAAKEAEIARRESALGTPKSTAYTAPPHNLGLAGEAEFPCPRCETQVPSGAIMCYACGNALR